MSFLEVLVTFPKWAQWFILLCSVASVLFTGVLSFMYFDRQWKTLTQHPDDEEEAWLIVQHCLAIALALAIAFMLVEGGATFTTSLAENMAFLFAVVFVLLVGLVAAGLASIHRVVQQVFPD